MAKQPKKRLDVASPVSPAKETALHKPVTERKGSWFSVRNQLILLVALCFVFYGNTIGNGYAFDDTMAIVDNEYVLQGVSGIPRILSTDAYQSYLELKGGSNQLGGGRYRPLSLISFAIEQQFMGTEDPDDRQKQLSPAEEQTREDKIAGEMHLRHFVNVCLYASLVAAIFFLLLSILPATQVYLPFVVSLLFLTHPIHTEVVANVKSRDEILSLLFICLTFLQYYKFDLSGKTKHLLYALGCYFAALLSKEYAVTLILLLPLFHYVFLEGSISKNAGKLALFLFPLGLYLAMRMASVSGPAAGADRNIMNYPYLYATGVEKIASGILVLLRYLSLLLWPHPLVADYSYAQIPYVNFNNPLVWLSITIYFAGAAAMFILLKKRHFAGFAMAFYFVNLALVSNFLFNIGAPMGERLVFHSSLGFELGAGWAITEIIRKSGNEKVQHALLAGGLVLITICCGAATIARNGDWKDNQTLFLHDVQIAPNSVLVNNDAAAACMSLARQNKDTSIRNQWFAKAIGYYDKAISIHHGYSLAYLNRGLCYFNSGNPVRAIQDWDSVRVQNPAQQNLTKYLGIAGRFFLGKGIKEAQSGRTDLAKEDVTRALEAVPDFSDAWYNLGLIYLNANQIPEARQSLQKTLQYNPGNREAQQLLERMNL